ERAGTLLPLHEGYPEPQGSPSFPPVLPGLPQFQKNFPPETPLSRNLLLPELPGSPQPALLPERILSPQTALLPERVLSPGSPLNLSLLQKGFLQRQPPPLL